MASVGLNSITVKPLRVEDPVTITNQKLYSERL